MSNSVMRAGRVLALAAAVGLTGLLAAQERVPAQPSTKGDPAADAASDHYMQCAKACDDCARICDRCGEHCAKLVADGHKHHMETLKTCQDCAAVCRAASGIVSRHGPFSDLICQACADACKRCGDACRNHGADDPMMKQCAEECRKCEKACRDMLAHVGKGGDRK